ncbi:MAG: Crp/Fnr family transcriptional regulator [Shimia sp.]
MTQIDTIAPSPFDTAESDDADILASLAFTEANVPGGTDLMRAGEVPNRILSIVSGQAMHVHHGLDDMRAIDFAFPGDLLGLRAVWNNELDHTIVASTPMRVRVYAARDVRNLMGRMPQQAYGFGWKAAMRTHFMAPWLNSGVCAPAPRRMAWGMLHYMDRAKLSGIGDGSFAPFPFRQQDWADILGLSLVHTNKTLGKFRQAGVASMSSEQLTIEDRSKLRETAGMAA